MRRLVFGLGGAQVAATMALAAGAAWAAGATWQAGIALGGVAAMSSTAIVSRLLAERGELESPHGREVIAVTNFAPRQVGPFMSEVLCLGAVQADGRVVMIRPDGEGELGARIA